MTEDQGTSQSETKPESPAIQADPRRSADKLIIDFQGMSNGQKELKAGKLRDFAVERGKLHPANSVKTEDGAS